MTKTSSFQAAAALGWLVLQAAVTSAPANTNLSVWVYPGPSGRLIAQPDALGNRILDCSGVGYLGGAVPLPSSNTVPVAVTISPVAGDNVANLQNAINQVAALPLGTNGFRGAVLLLAGEYPLSNTVTISASGVVLRGVGSSTNGTGTVLRATATNQYTLLEVSGSGSASTVSGTTHNITNNYVPVGARSFNVDSASGLSVGDTVFVERLATQAWIDDLGMNLLGPSPDVPWTPSGYNINSERVITHLEGNHVFVDWPLACAIDAHYTNGSIRQFTWSGRLQNVGIEHIYAVSDYFGSVTNETHGWTFIEFDNVVNGWVRDVVSQYFGYSCVNLNSGAKYITVQDCQCLDPISIITGGRRYAFAINDCQLCLVKNCYTRQDRHQFVTQSLTIGPCVFVDGTSDSANAEAGPHQRWATGILWDHITVNGNNLDAQNAGNYGTGHGWEGANCVIWNSAAKGFIVQNPPGARNWLIGSVGPIQTGTAYVGPHAPGTYDSSGSGATNVFPDSLYFAQLQDRLASPGLQARDYWLGAIDAFTNGPPDGVVVPVDAGWRAAVQASAAGQPLDNFDVVTNNHWVPFTFNYSLSSTEHVVAATLSLSLLAAYSATNDALYLGSLSNSFTFAALQWLPIATAVTNPTVRVLDLTSQLSLLTNGQLNAALQGDIGVDWAMLELEVAPNSSASPTTLAPVADATVWGGVNATNNYGSAATLTAELNSSANSLARAYLRWDLTGVSGNVTQARVSLTPLSVGTGGIEQGIAVSATDTWSETGLTWNNQPGGGERFATWMPGTNGPVSFDVTPQVLDALTGDKQLSLELFSLVNLGAAGVVTYASREYSDPNSRPQLTLWIPPSPPTISNFTNVTVPVNGSTGPLPFSVGDAQSPASALLVSGACSNPSLAPPANIVFGGSGSNRTVTVTPALNQSGQSVITVTVTDPGNLSASASFTLTVESHAPGTYVWNGPGVGANAWSASGNWSPAGPPDAFDDVKFFDSGAGGVAVSNINNAVDAGFGGTVASLQYGNTNGNHTTFINPGATLSLIGLNGLVAGTETDNGQTQTVSATVTGPGARLVVDNSGANLVVRQGTANSGGSQRATLDLSGLGNLSATLNQVLVGVIGPVNRPTGTLLLARTNTLTATGSPGLCVADSNSNAGGQNLLYLGQTNAIFVDSIVIARQKGNATLRFNPAFANPAVCFRGSDGSSRVSSWNIADNSLQSTSSSSALGTNDFSGGTVDALVDTLVLGKSQKTTGAGSTGVLTFTSGTFDVNTVQVGQQAQSGATSGGVGRVNVNGPGAVLIVNTTLELGSTSGGIGTTNTSGTLSINGGTVLANAILVGAGSGTNTLAIANGTLAVTNSAGSPAAPINLIALTNATLQFQVAGGTTNLVAASLITGGTSNTIGITSLPAISSFPAQFTLVAYSGAVGGAGFNFVLGALPAGVYCGGLLSNNVANHTVDLVITNCLAADLFLTWNGNVSDSWDTETPNWKNNLTQGLIYAEGESVVFNDAASGTTTIDLEDTRTPASVTLSNNTQTYTFVGLGKLSGSTPLVLQGLGPVILANSGSNDFTGGVVIDGGTLCVGNGGTNGSLPAGSVVNNGSLVFNRSDDLTTANTISGSGTLTKNGAGVLTLNGANACSGGTFVNAGTLALTNAGSLAGSSNITLAIGATLDVSGRTNGTLTLLSGQTLSGNGTLNGSLTVSPGATVSPGIAGIGALAVANVLTLQGATAMDLGSGTNDVLNGAASIAYGGTLALAFPPGSLAAGDSFKLFNAAGYIGSFNNIQPSAPGPGLAWDTSTLNNGVLSIVLRPAIAGVARSAGSLIIVATNGLLGGSCYVASSTNLSLPLADWTLAATNVFDGNGTFRSTNTFDPNLPQCFYRLRLP
ncbi:MAG: DNRLRE domain-containing protein [Verrucomicrobiota bacterium]